MSESSIAKDRGLRPSEVLVDINDVARWWKASLDSADESLWSKYKIQPKTVLPILQLAGIHRRMKNGQYSRVHTDSGPQTTFPSEMADTFKKAIIDNLSLKNLKTRGVDIMLGEKGLTEWTTLTYAIPEDFPELVGPITDNLPGISPSGDRWGDETFVQTTLIKAAEEKDPEKKEYYKKLLQKFDVSKSAMLVWSSVAAGSRLDPAPEKYKQRIPELASTLRDIFPDMEKYLQIDLEVGLGNPDIILKRLNKVDPKQVKRIWGS